MKMSNKLIVILLFLVGALSLSAMAQEVKECPSHVTSLYSSATDLRLLSCQTASEIGNYKEPVFVTIVQATGEDDGGSVYLNLYKAEGFNLRSQPLAVEGPFTALAWFDVDDKKRLRSWIGDIDADGQLELALNAVIPPQATAFYIFNYDKDAQKLKPVVPVNLTDEEVDPFFFGAGKVIVSTERQALKVLGGRYGDDRVYKVVNGQFVEQ